MTPTQALTIAEMVSAICPAQRFNEMTPDAWAALLAATDFEDARAALLTLGTTERFIAPADIIRQVRLARRNRLRTHVVPAPTNPDDAPGYRAQMQASLRTAATPPTPGRLALTAGPDEITRRRAAHLRAANGGKMVDPTTAPKAAPALVRDRLAEVRRQCEAAAKARRGENAPRRRWTPPADPTPRRSDLAPLSATALRDALGDTP